MDVVRANITALGGVVDVASKQGHGTTITMTLPITLAIIQALIVGVDAAALRDPAELGARDAPRSTPREVQRSDGRELLNLRGEALLLRRLAVEFGLGDPRRRAGQAVRRRARHRRRRASASSSTAWRGSRTS